MFLSKRLICRFHVNLPGVYPMDVAKSMIYLMMCFNDIWYIVLTRISDRFCLNKSYTVSYQIISYHTIRMYTYDYIWICHNTKTWRVICHTSGGKITKKHHEIPWTMMILPNKVSFPKLEYLQYRTCSARKWSSLALEPLRPNISGGVEVLLPALAQHIGLFNIGRGVI